MIAITALLAMMASCSSSSDPRTAAKTATTQLPACSPSHGGDLAAALAATPLSPRAGSAVLAVDTDHVVVLGGRINGPNFRTALPTGSGAVFSVSCRAWHTLPALPAKPGLSGLGAAVIGDRLIAAGYRCARVTNDEVGECTPGTVAVWSIRLGSRTWQRLPDPPITDPSPTGIRLQAAAGGFVLTSTSGAVTYRFHGGWTPEVGGDQAAATCTADGRIATVSVADGEHLDQTVVTVGDRERVPTVVKVTLTDLDGAHLVSSTAPGLPAGSAARVSCVGANVLVVLSRVGDSTVRMVRRFDLGAGRWHAVDNPPGPINAGPIPAVLVGRAAILPGSPPVSLDLETFEWRPIERRDHLAPDQQRWARSHWPSRPSIRSRNRSA